MPRPLRRTPSPADKSHGYEAAAREFIAARSRSSIGAATVRDWARDLPGGGAVLDIGCGHGVPITQALLAVGLAVHGVDASPSMIAEFRRRFPHAAAQCCPVEESRFFERTFDGVVAWGLMFLLSPAAQTALIHKVAGVLTRGGRFLFTCPRQACEWPDNLTGETSVSLGAGQYHRIFEAAGLTLAGERDDEGENHYYLTLRS